MYVIIVYDVGEKRVGKMLKLCRQYLCWIQNSVLEGELSEAKLRELYMNLKAITPEQKVENPETSDVNIFLILSLVAVGAFGTTLVLKNRLS